MKNNNVLITGITGQDGSYLTEYLLSEGYNIYGMIRRKSVVDTQNTRLEHLLNNKNMYLEYGDLSDITSIEHLIKTSNPDYIFHLGAQSNVRISSDIPLYTLETNVIGTTNILESFRKYAPNARFYNAASSEIFGNNCDQDGYQSLKTSKYPTSPYGVSKLATFHLTRHYRKAFNIFACNGILFNHTSPRRSMNFVIPKIIKGALSIFYNEKNTLTLGDLDTKRDFGHSYDYVRAMKLILDYKIPDDFIIATGENHSIREICDYVFKRLNMDYKQYVKQDKKYFRPEELRNLKGDSAKARQLLNWKPKYTFYNILDEMITDIEDKLYDTRTDKISNRQISI